MRIYLTLLLLICLLLPGVGHAKLSPSDTVLLHRLFEEATQAHYQGQAEISYAKLDSFIAIGFENGSGYYAIGIGLAYKGIYGDENDHLDIYYQSIMETARQFPKYEVELGGYGGAIYINNETRLGHYYKRRGSFFRAEDKFNEIYEQHKAEQILSNLQITNLLLQLGSINKDIGNYQVALSFALESRDSFRVGNPDYYTPGYEGLINKNIADIYAEIRQYDDAILYYNRALNTMRNVVLTDSTARNIRNRIITTYHGFSNFCLENNQPQRAIGLLKESLVKHLVNDPFLEKTYRLLGEAYTKEGKVELAAQYFGKSRAANQFPGKNYQLAETYLAQGKMYATTDNFDQALASYQLALTHLDGNFDEKEYCQNPMDFDKVFARRILLQVLHQKALALAVHNRNNQGYSNCAFETIRLAIQLFDNIAFDNATDFDKQLFVNNNYSIFEDAIRISLMRENDESTAYALEVSERSKAMLLLNAVRNTHARDYGVPDDLLDQEQQLKYQIRNLTEKIYDARLNRRPTTLFEERLREFYKELDTLNDHFKHNYSSYYSLRNNNEVDSGEAIEQRLESGEVLVEYFIGDRNIYAFVIQKDEECKAYTIPVAPLRLEQLTQSFLHAIYVPYTNENTPQISRLKSQYTKEYSDEVFAKNGYLLYQYLLQPFLERLPSDVTTLTIVPDGVLNYLPFDALLQHNVSDENLGYYENRNDYQYIAYDYRLSYCYSATLLELMENAEVPSSSRSGILAFDVYEDWSENQTQTIYDVFSSYWSSDDFVNLLRDRSHELSLREEGPAYNYLHFAAHGIVDNEHPHRSNLYLRPSPSGDSLLYLKSIYGLDLPAGMVFTSACQAGIGRLSRGEGLLSLARGFAYAGAKSLVTTLWSVSVGSSNLLVPLFYEKLKGGMDKDDALFLAKKELLQIEDAAHPYHWAGYIPIGDMAAIEKPNGSLRFLFIGGALLFGVVVFFKRKKGVIPKG